MKLTDKERNTCAALLCRWAARDNELMASDLYGSSQYYKLLGALTALRTLGLRRKPSFQTHPRPAGITTLARSCWTAWCTTYRNRRRKWKMKTQTIRLPSDNALRCRALAQENAALRAAAARWAKARRLALAVNGTIGAVGVGLVVGSGLPAALCLTPWDWPLTLAGAVLAGAACVVECALTDRYTRQ